MHISDLLGQYHQGTPASSGAKEMTGTKGVENLVSSLKSLTKGNIFEGTVSSVKNGKVTLALSNGTQITARMDGKVPLSVGQSMFFQVKSNDGSQIAIRPFTAEGNGGNYALLQALSAAGLPSEPDYLSMVNRMMQEQMPIDKNSLQQMARLMNSNRSIDPQTLVQLQKLGIPLSVENASQFENYLQDKQAITSEILDLVKNLSDTMGGQGETTEALRQMNGSLLSVVTEEAGGVIGENNPLFLAVQHGTGASDDLVGAVNDALSGDEALTDPETVGRDAGGGEEKPASVTEEIQTEDADTVSAETKVAQTGAGEAVLGENIEELPTAGTRTAQTQTGTNLQVEAYIENVESYGEHTLGAVLDEKQLETLNQILGKLVGGVEPEYAPQKPVMDFLMELGDLLKSPFSLNEDGFKQLFSSKEFEILLKDAIEKQWTIKPEELSESDTINRLYEKMIKKLDKLTQVTEIGGKDVAALAELAKNIKSNIQFMNQINELYTYAQIPLKMSGQSASGELYVYTNKKALAEKEGELTAFLHLDMEHLGPTDVSVKMIRKEVSTNFYLQDDAAYELIQKHLPLLQDKLKAKGYQSHISVVNESHHVNFVEDFLKKEKPSAGQLHRYSFDMRA